MKLSTFFLILTFSLTTMVFAKNPSPSESQKFFVLFDDGCEHPVETCESKSKLPKKLQKKGELGSDPNYLGTVQIEFADKNAAGIDAYEHYFNDKKSCELALKKKSCGPAGEGE